MFCPKCATQNLEGASFCRSCGANISLVPQALTGQLPEASPAVAFGESLREARRRRRRSATPSMADGIRQISMGVGFLLVAMAIGLFGREMGGQVWWFWMLIPAFALLGKGISQIVQAKQQDKSLPAQSATLSNEISSPQPFRALPSRNTAQLMPTPPSVTEGTTRHLGAEAPTRHLESERDE
ncbi:MAG: zinc ribbon domain-containing protein [Pyrinomonadaceae bacterium]